MKAEDFGIRAALGFSGGAEHEEGIGGMVGRGVGGCLRVLFGVGAGWRGKADVGLSGVWGRGDCGWDDADVCGSSGMGGVGAGVRVESHEGPEGSGGEDGGGDAGESDGLAFGREACVESAVDAGSERGPVDRIGDGVPGIEVFERLVVVAQVGRCVFVDSMERVIAECVPVELDGQGGGAVDEGVETDPLVAQAREAWVVACGVFDLGLEVGVVGLVEPVAEQDFVVSRVHFRLRYSWSARRVFIFFLAWNTCHFTASMLQFMISATSFWGSFSILKRTRAVRWASVS